MRISDWSSDVCSSDLQITFVNPLNTAASETLNGTRPATIKGIEADLTVKAFRALTMTANYTYTDAHLSRQQNPFSGELIMARVIYIPEHAASLLADYDFPPFSFGQLSAPLVATYSFGHYSPVNDDIGSASLRESGCQDVCF